MTIEIAKQHFLQGLAELQQGALKKAEASFGASLALVPDRPSTLTNLAAVRLGLGKTAEALTLMERACSVEPSNVMFWLQTAQLQQDLNQVPQALESLARALALEPGNANAWSNQGMLLRELRRFEEAVASFEKAIALGADAELNRFYVASVKSALQGGAGAAGVMPVNAPRAYVERLFDNYAADFSDHLVQALKYRGHERLVGRLLERETRRFGWVLDVGCGGGLCGAVTAD